MASGRDYIIFPDTNVLLDLYRQFDDKWAKVAGQLPLLAESLLVTRQVADELARQKATVVRDALDRSIQKVTAPHADLPPGLREHETALRAACKQVNDVRSKIEETAQKHLSDVAIAKDEVSVALGHTLASSVQATADQLERARNRRERGNPPGKPRDPLGDQLSWEQLLDRLTASTRLIWVVTRDGDFASVPLKKGEPLTLNPFLHAEIKSRAAQAEVRICGDLASAINDYLKETGANEAFSPAELAYFAHADDDDDEPDRKPWQCLRDGENTPIESLVCAECRTDESRGCGEEVYAINEQDGGYEVTLSPDNDRSSPIECGECGCTVFEVEFGTLCSYCDHVASKD